MVRELDNSPGDEPALIEKKIHRRVVKLLDLARSLRNAIVERAPDKVWDVLAQQEEHAALLEEYSRLWEEMTPPSDNPEKKQLKEKIRRDLRVLKTLQKSNTVLAQSFLSAIRKALGRVTDRGTSEKRLYDRRGRPGLNARSVLIKRIG